MGTVSKVVMLFIRFLHCLLSFVYRVGLGIEGCLFCCQGRASGVLCMVLATSLEYPHPHALPLQPRGP